MKNIIKNIYSNVFFRLTSLVIWFLITYILFLSLSFLFLLCEKIDIWVTYLISFICLIFPLLFVNFVLDITKFSKFVNKYIWIFFLLFLLIYMLPNKPDYVEILLLYDYAYIFALLTVWASNLFRRKLRNKKIKQSLIFFSSILLSSLYIYLVILVDNPTDLIVATIFIISLKFFLWFLIIKFFDRKPLKNPLQRKFLISSTVIEMIICILYMNNFSYPIEYSLIEGKMLKMHAELVIIYILAYISLYTFIYIYCRRKAKEIKLSKNSSLEMKK